MSIKSDTDLCPHYLLRLLEVIQICVHTIFYVYRHFITFLPIIRPDFTKRLTDACCDWNCERGKICDVIFSDILSQCGSRTTFHIQFMQKNKLFSSEYTESNPWTKAKISNLDPVPLFYRVIKKYLCTWWLQYNHQVHRYFLINLYNFGHSWCSAHNTNCHWQHVTCVCGSVWNILLHACSSGLIS
jgi:hypothetical protein